MPRNLQSQLLPAACDVRNIDVFRARKTPEAVALQFEGCEVSYAKLSQLVTQLGILLTENKTDGYVVICMTNGLEPAVAYLACLRYGIKFAIVHPDLDSETLAKVFGLISPWAVLTNATTYSKPDLGSFHKFQVNLDELELHKQSADLEWINSDNDHEAAVVFSSGSTGQPKGICHSYATLNALVDHSCLLYPSGIDLFSVPMAGLGGLQMLLTALALGKTTRLLASSRPDLIVDAIHTYLPERMLLFPAIIATLVAESRPDDAWVSKIKECHSGGDSISSALIETFHKLTGLIIQHAYGMAEFGVILKTSGQVGGPPTFNKLPTGHIKLYLLNDRNELAEPGEIGHLHVESTSLMKGYRLDRSIMDGESIIPPRIPFPTNDFFRLGQDGTYKYIGRENDLIKIRDDYISIKEIEYLLQAESRCKNIVLFSNRLGELALCVQTSSRLSTEHQEEALQKAAEVALKPELHPKHIFFVDQLPLLGTTGKIDRQKIAQLLG